MKFMKHAIEMLKGDRSQFVKRLGSFKAGSMFSFVETVLVV